jgi:DNA mismatch repair protein MutS2
MRADARAALDAIVDRLKSGAAPPPAEAPPAPSEPIAPGMRVAVGALGLEGVIVELHGKQAEIDVRGKRLRAALKDIRPLAGSGPVGSTGRGPAPVRVNVALQPREGALSELNVIGATVDDALARVEKFLDESTMTDLRELRIVHGHGTGQLRRAITEFLRNHPLVAQFHPAPQNQGGGGATIVELRD